MKIRWYDMWLYRLFFWRWNKIFARRPDLRELWIANLKAFDVLDEGDQVVYKVIIEKRETTRVM